MGKKLELNVSTTSVEVPIIDNGKELGRFRFNPSDWDMVKRADEVVETFNNMEFSADTEESFFEATDKIKELVDYLIGYNVSEDIFKVCNPLSLCANGETYIEVILQGLIGLIEQVTEQRLNKKLKRVEKATAKYR